MTSAQELQAGGGKRGGGGRGRGGGGGGGGRGGGGVVEEVGVGETRDPHKIFTTQ